MFSVELLRRFFHTGVVILSILTTVALPKVYALSDEGVTKCLERPDMEKSLNRMFREADQLGEKLLPRRHLESVISASESCQDLKMIFQVLITGVYQLKQGATSRESSKSDFIIQIPPYKVPDSTGEEWSL